MQITMGIIANELKKKGYRMQAEPDLFCYIDTAAKFKITDKSYSDKILYIMDISLLEQKTLKEYPKNIILVGNTAETPFTADHLLTAPENFDSGKVYQDIMAIFAEYHQWDTELLLELLNQTSLQNLLELSVKKLNNPIAVFDNTLNIICYAGKFQNSIEGTIWQNILSPDMSPDDFHSIKEQKSISMFSMEKSKIPLLYHPENDPAHTYLASWIWIKEKMCGYIGMVDVNKPFSSGEQELVTHIITRLKLYFNKNTEYMSLVENQEDLLENLLNGLQISDELVSLHMGRLQWNPKETFRLIFISSTTDPLSTDWIFVTKQLDRIFPRGLKSIYKNELSLLLPSKYLSNDYEEMQKRFKDFLENHNFCCGISSEFCDIRQVSIYKTQAEFSLEKAYNSQSTITYYDTCQWEQIIETVQTQTKLQSICHPLIYSLWHSNKESNREFVQCFSAYLLNGRNIAETSRRLHLHRNTLIYRLNRISEILNIDIDAISDAELFYYLFSCIVVPFT